MPLAPGRRLGPYEIQASIGAGGMGEVYKAIDTRLDRTVAIKVLPEHVSADADLRQRLEREARSISKLNHPNICTLHDIGTQDGTDFLVMEYLEGETLGERIGREALPLAEAVQHGLVLLRTLEALHGLGLVHRDLKPSNIFLTPNGLKLLDFGLARSVCKDSESIEGADLTQLTQTGILMGTPRYMAPEALQGQSVDARADLFAMGAILYEMLSGKHAFDGPSVVDIAHAVLHDKPPLLTGSAAIVAADRVIHRALEKRADDRYQSAAAMARHRLINGQWPRTGLRTQMRRRLRGYRFETPDPFPPWIATDLVERLDLHRRHEAFASRQLDRTATRPEAEYQLAGPEWSFVLEGYDAGMTGFLAELRHPFFDVRMIDFCLALPAIPWLAEKYILRRAMKDRLPGSTLSRRKAPLSGYPPHEQLVARSRGPLGLACDESRLAEFVDIDCFTTIAKRPERLHAREYGLVTRPLGLALWLSRLGTGRRPRPEISDGSGRHKTAEEALSQA